MKLFVFEMITNLAEQFHGESNVLTKLEIRKFMEQKCIWNRLCKKNYMLIIDCNKLEYSNSKNRCPSYQILQVHVHRVAELKTFMMKLSIFKKQKKTKNKKSTQLKSPPAWQSSTLPHNVSWF